MLVSEFQEGMGEIMEDVAATQYTEAHILRWLVDGLRQLGSVRPDAYGTNKKIHLNPTVDSNGPFSVDATDLRLIQLVRNLGAAGTTVGSAIRGPMKMEEQDLADPSWHTHAATGEVDEYIWNAATPKLFWTYPMVPSTGLWVDAVVATLPTMPTESDDTIPIDEIYVPALLEWVQYRLFARDDEQAAFARGQAHYNSFFAMLGAKTQVDLIISPSVAEQQPAKRR